MKVSLVKCFLTALSLPVLLAACATSAPQRRSEEKQTVLFLCPYGGAKSVLAASYFNREAIARGLRFHGVAAATDEPYAAVPPAVADKLRSEAIDVEASDRVAPSRRISPTQRESFPSTAIFRR